MIKTVRNPVFVRSGKNGNIIGRKRRGCPFLLQWVIFTTILSQAPHDKRWPFLREAPQFNHSCAKRPIIWLFLREAPQLFDILAQSAPGGYFRKIMVQRPEVRRNTKQQCAAMIAIQTNFNWFHRFHNFIDFTINSQAQWVCPAFFKNWLTAI